MQQLFYQNEQDRLASDGPEDAEFGYGQIGELTQQLPYHDSSTFQASQALPPQSPQEAALLQQGLQPRTLDPTLSFPPPNMRFDN